MSRPLQVSLVGGSLAHFGLRLLEAFASENPALAVPSSTELLSVCGECPALLPREFSELHLPSLFAGVVLGLLLGPIVDTIYLLRVWWGNFVRARLRRARDPEQLYRILS